jgi:hypothetical protein
VSTLSHRLILALALLSQLLLGTGRGMVLCVESDGSVQLEVLSVSCCEPEAVHDLHDEDRLVDCSSSDEGCGGCTDQALQLIEGARGKQSLPPLVALPVGLAAVAPRHDRPARYGFAARPPLDGRLACLRTVVLRC